MKHENSHPGPTKGQHKYENGSYVEDKDFVPSEYPKYVDGKIVEAPEPGKEE